MSDNIVLGAATQQNLLSLQQINQQLQTTQGHLATGLKVASAVDNAVLFFQSQSLSNRANDLSTRKNNIDQGISSVTTATQGIQSAISILQQLQGIAQSAKTQTASQRASAASQFNTLAVQFNQLLNDSSYQGLNLVNSSTTNLTLQFSVASTSKLIVQGQNLLLSSLTAIQAYNGFSTGSSHSKGSGFSAFFANAHGVSVGSGHSKGSDFSAAHTNGTITLSSGTTLKYSTSKVSKFRTVAYTAGLTSKGSHHSAGTGISAFNLVAFSKNAATSGHSKGSQFSAIVGFKASVQATTFAGVKFSQAVSTGKTSAFDTIFNVLNTAISSAQASAQSFGANVSLLQTRLSFTAQYVTTLSGGSSKLTVADVNLESTNLVTLQTRQQLAIQSLSIATASEQAVLRLFH
jgi:flagellin-like hook-associated protein FlgL